MKTSTIDYLLDDAQMVHDNVDAIVQNGDALHQGDKQIIDGTILMLTGALEKLKYIKSEFCA